MQLKRMTFTTGTSWESAVGYARAVRLGPHIYISGTTATNERGELVGLNDAYQQTIQILSNIEMALNKAGALITDVVRTRVFVTDIDLWQQVGKAHGEVFANIKPASSMIEISRLIDPNMLVEIEADALIIDS